MELEHARRLAAQLYAEHGLVGWTFRFDRAKRRAGVCRFASREISLSAELTRLHDPDEVTETILHEIAHALVGPQHGHDEVWRATALRIGSNGRRCLDADVPSVPGAWRGTCPGGHLVNRHRRPERVLLCGRCRGATLERVFEWTHHGRIAAMHPNYAQELDAIRSGVRLVRYAPGTRVRLLTRDEWAGRRGTVVRRGRSRYEVRVGRTVVSIPFAGVEPC